MNGIVNWFKARPLWVRIALVGLLLAVLCGCCGAAGARLFPRTITITKTETKEVEHVVYKDRVVQGEVQYKDRVITTTVFAPGSPDAGCQLASETVEHDQTSDKKDTTTTASTVDTKTEDTKSETVSKPSDAPRFAAGVGVGLSPLRPTGAVVLLDFSVKPVTFLPLTVGAWGTLPTMDFQGTVVGLKIGVTW